MSQYEGAIINILSITQPSEISNPIYLDEGFIVDNHYISYISLYPSPMIRTNITKTTILDIKD
jgi:hypothetical protein